MFLEIGTPPLVLRSKGRCDYIYTVVSLKNSTINEQKNTISKSLNLLDAGHLPSGSYRGV